MQYLLCYSPALQDRCHRFLGDKMFEDLVMVANVALRELSGFLTIQTVTYYDKGIYLTYREWATA